MNTLREAAQQALEALEKATRYMSDSDYRKLNEAIDTLRAALAEPEQRPISDVTAAVTKTVIEVEKLLCGKIGRQWQPSGMSIQTLVDELAALVAAAEREACAKVCEEQMKSYMSKQYTTDPLGGFKERFAAEQCAIAIRARGE